MNPILIPIIGILIFFVFMFFDILYMKFLETNFYLKFKYWWENHWLAVIFFGIPVIILMVLFFIK